MAKALMAAQKTLVEREARISALTKECFNEKTEWSGAQAPIIPKGGKPFGC